MFNVSSINSPPSPALLSLLPWLPALASLHILDDKTPSRPQIMLTQPLWSALGSSITQLYLPNIRFPATLAFFAPIAAHLQYIRYLKLVRFEVEEMLSVTKAALLGLAPFLAKLPALELAVAGVNQESCKAAPCPPSQQPVQASLAPATAPRRLCTFFNLPIAGGQLPNIDRKKHGSQARRPSSSSCTNQGPTLSTQLLLHVQTPLCRLGTAKPQLCCHNSACHPTMAGSIDKAQVIQMSRSVLVSKRSFNNDCVNYEVMRQLSHNLARRLLLSFYPLGLNRNHDYFTLIAIWFCCQHFCSMVLHHMSSHVTAETAFGIAVAVLFCASTIGIASIVKS